LKDGARRGKSSVSLEDAVAKSPHVRPAAREELASVAQIDARAPNNVRHEGVARDQIAMSQRDRERVEVGGVARLRTSLRELMLDRPQHPCSCLQTPALRMFGKMATA
jgi:hypothetical protein